MKKLLLLLTISACAAGMSLDASARYKGDLNGDDRVNLADMVFLAKAINAGSTDKSLDVNSSGKVDDYDLHKLADIIISGKLTEDTGMNVGIGGWDDSGEDFGGTVKAPAFTARSAEETRFYMHSPKSVGNGGYSMEFGISEGNDSPAAILFNIRLPRELKFDVSRMIELDPSLSASHMLYGTPKFKKEFEDDEWNDDHVLRFIVFSPDLKALPSEITRLGNVFYEVNDCWGEPYFRNCQVASPDGVCFDIAEHDGGYSGGFKPVEVSSVWFDQSEMFLTEGEQGWLSANIDPWDATDQTLVWTSSDESVATVASEDGSRATVTAVKEGEAVITATASNGIFASCTVRVERRFVDVSEIMLDHTELNLTEGEAATLTATVHPEDATDKTLTWTSSDESVVTVSESGEVNAVAPGSATISVSSANGITAYCNVNVEARYIDVAEIILDQTELNLIVGDTAWLNATVNPEDATDKSLSWSSSDESVATVSENGEVVAIAPGSATITVNSNNGVYAYCYVNVEARFVEVTEISLSSSSLSLVEGDIANLSATVNPADATDKSISWSSSDESVAVVSESGEVVAVAAGETTITVTSSNGLTADCYVTVAKRVIPVLEVILDQTSLEMTEGDIAVLNATVNPDDATDKTLTWTSSDSSVVSVSENGVVTAVNAGTAVIIVSSSNGKTSMCEVNVEARIVNVESVSLDQTEINLIEGDTAWLNATVNPEDASDKTLTWTSNNESVVTVSESGEVLAVAPGSAIITVSASNGVYANCNVYVEARFIEVTEIVLSNTKLMMTEGDLAILSASVQPAEATDKTLTWTSSDETVATVSETGEIMALKEGFATITVTASNGVSASCTVSVESGIVSVTAVTLDKSTLELTEGDVEVLTATVNPEDATDKTLTWTSSNAAVASVSADGEVRALKAGTAVITVSSTNGKTATCEVRVAAKIIEVESVSLDQANLELTEGDTAMLTAFVNPENATDRTLTWTSSDTSVASVSAKGEVKALKAGTATVTVSTANGKTASCEVKVAARFIEVTGITLSNTELKLTVGETAALTAIVAPANATDKTLTWTSSDASVAAISENGEVKALKAGTATITVTASNGVSASCTVSVESGIVSVTAVTLDKSTLELTEGDVSVLTATVNPEDATDKTLTWTSSNASVASVSADGEVRALKAGTAVITVSSTNGKTASCEVTVAAKEIEMESIRLDAEELVLEIGDTHQFIATVLPAETTDQELEWWIDDENVAIIDQNGFVTMVGEGVTTVHVRSVRWNHVEAICRLNVTDAVEGVIADDELCDIFTSNGQLLKKGVHTSEIRNLDRGLYLIHQRGRTTKLLK